MATVVTAIHKIKQDKENAKKALLRGKSVSQAVQQHGGDRPMSRERWSPGRPSHSNPFDNYFLGRG
eukprot:CAMPEP_0180198546 /NCGR_PEP_ID=MMETSP0987-20121128/5238_1 /TAXON_ID=697907 /ORGANISM="non described non described, Strain CCMP2293" /LENGTH=65 /DNA_ID=CAMNT_0022153581 /DNA_START=29 /DNA_END=222 /DNA_ORIENTATION=-